MSPDQAYEWLAPKLSTEERKVLDVLFEAQKRFAAEAAAAKTRIAALESQTSLLRNQKAE